MWTSRVILGRSMRNEWGVRKGIRLDWRVRGPQSGSAIALHTVLRSRAERSRDWISGVGKPDDCAAQRSAEWKYAPHSKRVAQSYRSLDSRVAAQAAAGLPLGPAKKAVAQPLENRTLNPLSRGKPQSPKIELTTASRSVRSVAPGVEQATGVRVAQSPGIVVQAVAVQIESGGLQ